MKKKQRWDDVCLNELGIKYVYVEGEDDEKKNKTKA